jgi:hypothetical protein
MYVIKNKSGGELRERDAHSWKNIAEQVRSSSCLASGNDNLLPLLGRTPASIVINKIIISPSRRGSPLALGSLIAITFARAARCLIFPKTSARRGQRTLIIIISDQFLRQEPPASICI